MTRTPMELAFDADTARRLLESVDVEALLAGENVTEAVEYEALAATVGHTVGRRLVDDVVGLDGAGGAAGQAVGGTVGRVAAEWLIENLDAESLAGLAALADEERVESLVEGIDVEGGVAESARDWASSVEIPVEEA